MTFLTHRNRHSELEKMRRQRNMSQMKEQDKTIVRDLSETDTSNIPNREFKIMIIRYSLDLRKEWKTSVRPLTQR